MSKFELDPTQKAARAEKLSRESLGFETTTENKQIMERMAEAYQVEVIKKAVAEEQLKNIEIAMWDAERELVKLRDLADMQALQEMKEKWDTLSWARERYARILEEAKRNIAESDQKIAEEYGEQ